MRRALLILTLILASCACGESRAPNPEPVRREVVMRTCRECGREYVEFPYSDGRCSRACYDAYVGRCRDDEVSR